jgi:soluble lytic murein transglycosylase-like protein
MRKLRWLWVSLVACCSPIAIAQGFVVVARDGTVSSQEYGNARKANQSASNTENRALDRGPFLPLPSSAKLEKEAAVELLAKKASAHGMNFYLLLEIAIQESGLNEKAVSPKGAIGLMQVMPATGKRFGETNLYLGDRNIEAAISYLKYLSGLFGDDVRLVLAAYNAGEGAVIKYGYQVPPYAETQNYVRTILSRLQFRQLNQIAVID